MSFKILKFIISHVTVLILIFSRLIIGYVNSILTNDDTTTNLNNYSTKIQSIKLKKQIQSSTFIHSEKITKKYKFINKKNRNVSKRTESNDIYIVKNGDTLFYISLITGNNFLDLARRNNIHAPYILYVGQKLKINNIINHVLSLKKSINRNNFVKTKKKTNLSINSKQTIKSSNKECYQNKNKKSILISLNKSTKSIDNRISFKLKKINWIWPTSGKIIEKFSFISTGNKGIDIAGIKGQIIVASANGRVVYVGNVLRGYGNLIIIKHNNNYLSAYAHNNLTLVHERQEVKAGEKIATMGNTGTSSVRLHFEIRYKGKSVNPLQYLPKR